MAKRESGNFHSLPVTRDSSWGFSGNSLHVTSFLHLAFSVAFAVMAYRADADEAVPQTRLELTAANLASVVDPLMAEWIDKHQDAGAAGIDLEALHRYRRHAARGRRPARSRPRRQRLYRLRHSDAAGRRSRHAAPSVDASGRFRGTCERTVLEGPRA